MNTDAWLEILRRAVKRLDRYLEFQPTDRKSKALRAMIVSEIEYMEWLKESREQRAERDGSLDES